jgi:Protein kinase domain
MTVATAHARTPHIVQGSGGGKRFDLFAVSDNDSAFLSICRTEMIGQGAYGIVYRGTKEDTGQTVAIKRIPFADATPEGGVPCNVIREISLLRELDHPNVVRCSSRSKLLRDASYLFWQLLILCVLVFMRNRSSCWTSSRPSRAACTWCLSSSRTISRPSWTSRSAPRISASALDCPCPPSGPSSSRSLPVRSNYDPFVSTRLDLRFSTASSLSRRGLLPHLSNPSSRPEAAQCKHTALDVIYV